MRKLFTAAAIAAAAMVAAGGTVGAVKFGEPDTDNAYPWVGLMVAVDDDGEPLWRCPGSLLQETCS